MSDSAPAQARLFSPSRGRRPEPAAGARFSRGRVSIRFGRAEDCYAEWPAPTCLISDGPYGVDGFPGDRRSADSAFVTGRGGQARRVSIGTGTAAS